LSGISDEVLFASIVLLDFIAPLVLAYLVILKLRRIFELEADKIAALSTNPKYLSKSLVKLADYNFIPRKFSWIIGAFMSHPSITDRVDRLEEMR
jgi:Zn-dependent protease with chaperone function